MPVKNTELVVHHSIDGFIDKLEWEVMSRSIDHNRSVFKNRLIFHKYRKPSDVTELRLDRVSEPIAREQLRECFQSTYKRYVGWPLQSRLSVCSVESVAFLRLCEHTTERGIFNFDLQHVFIVVV